MKNPRPLIWRNSHPYCLADRFLDVTPPTQIEENEKCDRQIALYGYLRGTNFPALDARVHVPGVGDLTVREIEALPDPCPTPYLDQAIAKATGKSTRRRLGEKQKVLFAPMSDVGGVLVDKDAVYIDIKTNTFDREAEDLEDRGLGEQLMVSLQNERRLLGEATADGVRLFQGGMRVSHADAESEHGRKQKRGVKSFANGDALDGGEDEDEGFVSGEESEDDELDDDLDGDLENISRDQQLRTATAERLNDVADATDDLVFAESDSDLGSISEDGEDQSGLDDDDESEFRNSENDEDDGGLRWKDKIADNAKSLHASKIAYRAADLSKLMYDLSLLASDVLSEWRADRDMQDEEQDEKREDEEDEDFFERPTPRKKSSSRIE